MDISNLREQYTLSSLSKSDVHADPIEQFKKWLQEAMHSESPEPNAMSLATVDKNGAPSVRIVLLKEVSPLGFIFYTNYESKKANDMDINKNIAAVFNWLELHRQVRIEGQVSKISRAHSEKYFHSRPRKSQIGAVVSQQSSPIESRKILEEKQALITQQMEGLEKIPMPNNWGGYLIEPQMIEFWQGRRSRLHDRIQYSKLDDKTWSIQRLSP